MPFQGADWEGKKKKIIIWKCGLKLPDDILHNGSKKVRNLSLTLSSQKTANNHAVPTFKLLYLINNIYWRAASANHIQNDSVVEIASIKKNHPFTAPPSRNSTLEGGGREGSYYERMVKGLFDDLSVEGFGKFWKIIRCKMTLNSVQNNTKFNSIII